MADGLKRARAAARATRGMDPRDYRNLHPTPAAVVAMTLYGKEYSEQRGGSMDFWEKLSRERKNVCEHTAAQVIAAHKHHTR